MRFYDDDTGRMTVDEWEGGDFIPTSNLNVNQEWQQIKVIRPFQNETLWRYYIWDVTENVASILDLICAACYITSIIYYVAIFNIVNPQESLWPTTQHLLH